MEAPEKIYIDDPTGEFDNHWSIFSNNDSIEYVRKDAFVKKTCEWIKENITNNPNANSVLVRNGCVTLGMLVDDFKNYMKGE